MTLREEYVTAAATSPRTAPCCAVSRPASLRIDGEVVMLSSTHTPQTRLGPLPSPDSLRIPLARRGGAPA